MGEPLENMYFNWLCAKVLEPNSNVYLDLLKRMHRTEFVWLMPGDDNRAGEGLDVRQDFLRELNPVNEFEWDEPCSMLEMVVGFSKRASFQTGASLKEWFWEILTNLNLEEYRMLSEDNAEAVDDILNTVIWRTYDYAGHGGLFPMRWPKEDQREVEIWYQWCQYVEEQGLF